MFIYARCTYVYGRCVWGWKARIQRQVSCTRSAPHTHHFHSFTLNLSLSVYTVFHSAGGSAWLFLGGMCWICWTFSEDFLFSYFFFFLFCCMDAIHIFVLENIKLPQFNDSSALKFSRWSVRLCSINRISFCRFFSIQFDSDPPPLSHSHSKKK